MSEGNGDKSDLKDMPEIHVKLVNPPVEEKKKKGGFLARFSGGARSAGPAMGSAGAPGGLLSGLVGTLAGGGGAKLLGLGLLAVGLGSGILRMKGNQDKTSMVVPRKAGLGGVSTPGGEGGGAADESLGFLKYANPNFKFDEGAKKPEEKAVGPAEREQGEAAQEAEAEAGQENPMAGVMDQVGQAAEKAQAEAGAQGQPQASAGFKGKEIGKLSSSLGNNQFGSVSSKLGAFGGERGDRFKKPSLRNPAAGKLAIPKGAKALSARSPAGRRSGNQKAFAALGTASSDARKYSKEGHYEAAHGGQQTFDGASPITGGGLGPGGGGQVAPAGGGNTAGTGATGAQEKPDTPGFAAPGSGGSTKPPWAQAQLTAQIALILATVLITIAGLVHDSTAKLGDLTGVVEALIIAAMVAAMVAVGAGIAMMTQGQAVVGGLYAAAGGVIAVSAMGVMGMGLAFAEAMTLETLMYISIIGTLLVTIGGAVAGNQGG